MQVRTGVYFSRGHVPALPNPNHRATALHSVLHTGGEEPLGSSSDPPNTCPRKPDDRIRIWGPFQVLLLGITKRGNRVSCIPGRHFDASARHSAAPGHLSVVHSHVSGSWPDRPLWCSSE